MIFQWNDHITETQDHSQTDISEVGAQVLLFFNDDVWIIYGY